MTGARWDLWVHGRLRRRIALTDGGADALAELSMPHSKRGRRRKGARAEDRYDVAWSLSDDGQGVVASRDGIVHAAVRGDRLTVGDREYAVAFHDDGPRSARVTAQDGTPMLDVRADSGRRKPWAVGRRRPWAVLRFGDGTPLPLPAVLAVAYTLLRDEADSDGGGCLFECVCELLASPF